MDTVQLQGIGHNVARLASDFKVGESAAWNYGYTSEILAIAPRGRTQLTWTLKSEDGTVATRVVKADRLIGMAWESVVRRYATAIEIDSETMFAQLKRDPKQRKQFLAWQQSSF